MSSIMKKLWRGWKSAVHRINDGVAWIVMSLTFFIAVMPVALVFKIMRRDLLDRGLGPKDTDTFWLIKKNEEIDIRRAQRQF